jgi:hypothetical protein
MQQAMLVAVDEQEPPDGLAFEGGGLGQETAGRLGIDIEGARAGVEDELPVRFAGADDVEARGLGEALADDAGDERNFPLRGVDEDGAQAVQRHFQRARDAPEGLGMKAPPVDRRNIVIVLFQAGGLMHLRPLDERVERGPLGQAHAVKRLAQSVGDFEPVEPPATAAGIERLRPLPRAEMAGQRAEHGERRVGIADDAPDRADAGEISEHGLPFTPQRDADVAGIGSVNVGVADAFRQEGWMRSVRRQDAQIGAALETKTVVHGGCSLFYLEKSRCGEIALTAACDFLTTGCCQPASRGTSGPRVYGQRGMPSASSGFILEQLSPGFYTL